jgi:hypothetical protein
MAHAVKKTYRKDSPGARRREAGTTLTMLKRAIANSSNKTAERKRLHQQGLLGDLTRA